MGLDQNIKNSINNQIQNIKFFNREITRLVQQDSSLSTMEWDKRYCNAHDSIDHAINSIETVLTQYAARNYDYSQPNGMPKQVASTVYYYRKKLTKACKSCEA
jgi:hypothetical protein